MASLIGKATPKGTDSKSFRVKPTQLKTKISDFILEVMQETVSQFKSSYTFKRNNIRPVVEIQLVRVATFCISSGHIFFLSFIFQRFSTKLFLFLIIFYTYFDNVFPKGPLLVIAKGKIFTFQSS